MYKRQSTEYVILNKHLCSIQQIKKISNKYFSYNTSNSYA